MRHLIMTEGLSADDYISKPLAGALLGGLQGDEWHSQVKVVKM
ncbi:MAG: hypothetical protein R2795_04615 [Saprospiraceae bacterium]